jgi:hypothetical protein
LGLSRRWRFFEVTVKKPVWLMIVALACLMILDAGPVEARRPSRPRPTTPSKPGPRPSEKDMLLVVQLVPPKPPKKGVKVKPSRGGRYSRHNATRRSKTLYLRSTPGGSAVTALPVGVKVRVLKKGKTHSKVETGGGIRVSGYVPNVVLGMRIQEKAKLYGRAGGKHIGEISRSQLVHVEKLGPKWVRVQVLGYIPLRCWIKRKVLSVQPARYGGRIRSKYPGGSKMNLTAGKVHAKPGGPVVATALDEGLIYRVRVMGRWSQIAMYDYSRVGLRGWVLTERLSWRGSPWYGTGYRQKNCTAGTSGNQVALSAFKLYAQLDDAWPTIRVMPNARFNTYRQKNGWVRITSRGCLSFTGFAEDRPGDWSSAHLVRK